MVIRSAAIVFGIEMKSTVHRNIKTCVLLSLRTKQRGRFWKFTESAVLYT